MKKTAALFVAMVVALSAVPAFAVPSYVSPRPLAELIKTPVSPVRTGATQKMPLITWGGDIATILMNGNSKTTVPGSIAARNNLSLELFREDSMQKQVEVYLSGQTPYLRGTVGMIAQAMEVICKDPRTCPKAFYLLTRSTGGDVLVVKEGIHNVADLKGKTIAVQAYGPHVDFLNTVLALGGLTVNDVKVKWVKDITGSDQSPAEALRTDSSVDAAFVISPDAAKLTSGGTVGDGAEESVRGARTLFSSKTADHVIFDVILVRSDYYDAHKSEVESLAHALLLAQEELARLVESKDANPRYKETFRAAAEILLDSKDAMPDAEGMYADCTFGGFRENVGFFGGDSRNLTRVNADLQKGLVAMGMLSAVRDLDKVALNYNTLKEGLTKTEGVTLPKFDEAAVASVVTKRMQQGNKEGEIFYLEIFFKPNQNTFNSALYEDKFKELVKLADTFGGAIITVEGHSDPLGYLKQKQGGASQMVLSQLRQASKNLSMSRAVAVRDSIIAYAATNGVSLERTQFSPFGHGIEQPRSGVCGGDPCAPKSEKEWLDNMRVEFRVVVVEAESNVFSPL